MKSKVEVIQQEEELRQSMRRSLEQQDYEQVKKQLRESILVNNPAPLKVPKDVKTSSKSSRQKKTLKRIPIAPKGFRASLFKGIGILFALIGIFNIGLLGSPTIYEQLLSSLPFLLIGGASFLYGSHLSNLRKAYTDFAQVLIHDGKASFKELSFARGTSEKNTLKELEALKKRNFFKRIFIDREHDTVVIGPNTVARYLQEHVEKLEHEVPQTKNFNEQIDHLNTIKKAVSRIDDLAIKERVSHIQYLAELIIKGSEEHDAGSRAEIRRFLNHYLPMSSNLISHYAELTHQSFMSESLEQSKQSIAGSLDLIEEAFKSILYEIYDKNAIDIESEINAMEYMFRTDGLTK